MRLRGVSTLIAEISLLLCICLCFHYAPVNGQVPSWKCRVCEDVVQTWHDKYHCAGGFVDWGSPTTPDIRACQGPQFTCERLNGKIQTTCYDMRKEFLTESLMNRQIWTNMMLTNDPYRTCQELGKCDPDTNTDLTPCHEAFADPQCMHNPACKSMVQNCTERCYVCNWIVKGYPLFQEICRPEGAELPASVPLPGDQIGGAQFLELSSSANNGAKSVHRHGFSRRRRPQHYLTRFRQQIGASPPQQQRGGGGNRSGGTARFRTSSSSGSGSVSADPRVQQQDMITGFTLQEACHNMWEEVRTSLKFRYFVSWKKYASIMTGPMDRLTGIMWDANIVCKCLGKCEMGRFEDLALLRTCEYGAIEQTEMQYAFKYEGQPFTEYTPAAQPDSKIDAPPPNLSGETPPPVAVLNTEG